MNTNQTNWEGRAATVRADIPEAVLTSDFGCPNCLWAGVECRGGSKYREAIAKGGKPVCVAYVYYD